MFVARAQAGSNEGRYPPTDRSFINCACTLTMKKYKIRIHYIIPFEYEIDAGFIEEAETKGWKLASEEYENESTFNIDEEIVSLNEIV